jgi:hypothetical protein
VNGHELLRIARERYPTVVWELVEDRDGPALQGTETKAGGRSVRVLRYLRGDPADVVIESTRRHLRKAKPLAGRA